jgi:hypothetical protein
MVERRVADEDEGADPAEAADRVDANRCLGQRFWVVTPVLRRHRTSTARWTP